MNTRFRSSLWLTATLLASVITSAAAVTSQSPPDKPNDVRALGLTAVAGVAVGHYTLTERLTGCTAILVEAGAVAGVDVRGSAPGTSETDLLNPVSTVEQVHAIVLSGGSAFGLDAASGVRQFLEERGVGFDMGVARVPIIPSAILFDLRVGSNPRIRPTADCGYRAASAATVGPVTEGNVGVGAGATVGKLFGIDRAMKGAVGTAALSGSNGIIVAALAAVNAAGDVIDPADGKVIAGVRTADGRALADARVLIRSGAPLAANSAESTTLGVVATNARLTKAQATRLAQMAQAGLARAIAPAHMMIDGDTVFALATGTRNQPADLGTLGALAADALAEAIVRAARAATGIPGFPAARDLAPRPR